MGPFASKDELLGFQDRWLRPAGICAIVGAFLFAASLALQQAGVIKPDVNVNKALDELIDEQFGAATN